MPTTVFSDASLSFNPTSSNRQILIPTHNVSTGNLTSRELSCSSGSSSELSSDQETSNSSVQSPDTTTDDYVTGPNPPHLKIVESPSEKYRFRYRTEMQATHGSILGVKSTRRVKSFPTVKLCNFKSPPGTRAVIRCSLYTADNDLSARVPHYHRLIGKFPNEELDDPFDWPVDRSNDYTAVLQSMTILYVKKDEMAMEMAKKKIRHYRKWRVEWDESPIIPTENQKKEARVVASAINKNRVCLRFEALLDDGSGFYKRICDPIFSQPISNMKNTETNDLRICRVDKIMGSCEGNEEVFIFVDKISKRDIKVKFFSEEHKWSAEAQFNQEDVHHQYGIVFKTPPFIDKNITKPVEVSFLLERPSDAAVSDSLTFIYQPDRSRYQGLGKRQRLESNVPLPVKEVEHQMISPSPVQVPLGSPSPSLINLDFSEIDIQDLFKDDDIMEISSSFEDNLSIPSLKIPSLTLSEELEKLPDPEKEMMSKVLGGDKGQELWQLYENEYTFDGVMESVDRNSVKCQIDCSTGPPTNPLSVANTKITFGRPEMMPPMRLREGSPRDLLSKKLNLPGPSKTVCLQGDPGNLTRQHTKLSEDNIIENTATIMETLLMWFKKKKLKDDSFKKCLTKLFMRTVTENKQSVLHVLATSTADVELRKFMEVLKSYNLCKAVVNITNERDEIPLHLAARQGSVEVVRMLLEGGSEVDAVDRNYDTPLHLAMMRDDDAAVVVSVLLTKPVDFTMCNREGQTYLHIAVDKKDPTLVSTLLVKMEGHSLNELLNRGDRKQGNTALHMAVLAKVWDIVKILLEKGANVSPKNFAGVEPLKFVFDEEDDSSSKIKKLLLEYGASYECCIKEEEDDEDDDFLLDCNDDEEEDLSSSLYSKEWGDCELMDKPTITKLCLLLDKDQGWKLLAQKFRLNDMEMSLCKDHWSPTLLLFTILSSTPGVTIEKIREKINELPTNQRKGTDYLDEMIFHRLI